MGGIAIIDLEVSVVDCRTWLGGGVWEKAVLSLSQKAPLSPAS